jgi:putative membrane protein
MHVKTFGTAVIVAILATGAATAGQSQSAQTPKSSTAPAGAPSVSANDREFIAEMTMAGLFETQLAQMTVEQAASEDVKGYGQMMLRDHGQANAELAAIAKQMKVTPPKTLDRKHQELVTKLSKLRGPEFDREYMAAMVDSHRSAVDQLRIQAGPLQPQSAGNGAGASTTTPAGASPQDRTAAIGGVAGGDGTAIGTSGLDHAAPALGQWAANTLPAVEQHLAQAEALHKKTR